MATSDAPISIGRVALTVRDLDPMAGFYEDIIGLGLIERSGEGALLGVDGKVLVELRQDRQARPFPNEAGLFHTAFLLPSRQDLGAWLRYAAERGIRLDGASHHGVSEALYLRDPEGNGIEIYRDLPRETWQRSGDTVHMTTRPLDLEIVAAGCRALAGCAPGHGHRSCPSACRRRGPRRRLHHRKAGHGANL